MDSTLDASMKGELSHESLMWINNQGRRQQPVLPNDNAAGVAYGVD